ncbi:MAG: hypothetical protein WBP94_00725 [Rhodomicrobiaceae bacterium]
MPASFSKKSIRASASSAKRLHYGAFKKRLTSKEAKFEAAKAFWREVEGRFRKEAPPRVDQDFV